MQGRRFFVSPNLLEKKVSSVQPLSWLLQNDLPLILEVPQRQQLLQKGAKLGEPSPQVVASNEQAQLMRIWVTTPDEPLSFALQPRCQFEVITLISLHTGE